MIKLQWKFPTYKWNSQKFNQTLRTKLTVQVRQAAREFVRAAIVKVPIDTGEAIGTFLPIGRFLNVSIPILNNHPTEKKNPETGSSEEKRLLFTFSSNQYGVYFEIDWQLFHFWFNEFFHHNYPNAQIETPWHSMEAGRDAFLEYMRTVAVERLPKLKDFIEVTYRDNFLNER